MKNGLLKKILNIENERRRRSLWRRIVSLLAAVVVFVTTYALVMPALTLETDVAEENGVFVESMIGEEEQAAEVTEDEASSPSPDEAEPAESEEPETTEVELTEEAEAETGESEVEIVVEPTEEPEKAEPIAVDYLTADGETFNITVEFDKREVLRGYMDLLVSEIPKGSYSYHEYLKKTVEAMWLDSSDDISEARFFDIVIKKDGAKFEPAYPAKVTIQYDKAINVKRNEELSIIHFAEDGTELITDVDLSNNGKEIAYRQDSFSVSGTILANNSSNSRASSMMLIVSDGTKYYAVDKDLVLHEINATKFRTSGNTEVEFLENDFVFDDEHGAENVGQLAPFLWGRDISTNNNHIQEYHNADDEYLQFYPNNGTYVEGYYPNGLVFTSKDVNTSAGNTALLLSGNAIYQKVNNPGKWPESNYTNTSKDFFLKIDNTSGTPTLTSYTDGSTSDRAQVYFVKPNVVQGEQGSSGGGSGTPDDELGAPDKDKKLTDNHDGTYTLSLSVKGASKGSTESAPGDVLLVMDISNSMKSSDMVAAKNAAVQFSGTLLGNPDNEFKLALETYSKTVTFPGVLDGFTSNQTYFEAMVNTITSDGSGETNWDDALNKANSYFTNNGSGATAPKYVVFITDGKPNAYGTSGTVESYNYPTESTRAYPPAEANALALKNNGTKIFLVAVESSESTLLEYNAMHQHMKKLATALFNDENAYYTADESTLIRILAEIATEINKEYTYKKVTIEDGITAGSLGTGVNGAVSNFTYTITKKDGTETTYNSYADLVAAYPGIGSAAYNSETGTVSWPLGDNYKLEDGTTYTVNFTVWPSQTAYDAITDLKNGTKTYAEVIAEHPELAETLTSSGDYVTNKVGSAKVSYESYVTITTGDDTQEYKVGGGTVDMQNPDPEELSTSKATIRKDWISYMMPNWTVTGEIYLGMQRDNDPNWIDWSDPYTRIVVSSDSTPAAWTASRYIAPGILISPTKAQAEGIDTTNLTEVTFNGDPYYRLNSGHTYKFTEDKTKNFQLEDKTYHPMIVDGVTYNTTHVGDAYTSTDDDMSALVATNRMRGGVNIFKVVQDSDGNVIEPTDLSFSDSFTMHAKITAPSGEVNKYDTTSVPGKVVVWYDIYDINGNVRHDYPQWQNGTNYLEFNTTTGVAEGDLPPIKNGEAIRLTNLVTGSLYEVTEVGDNAGNYEKTYTYEYIAYDKPINGVAQPKDPVPNPGRVIGQDRQNNVTVTNKMSSSDVILKKTDDKGTPITSADNTAVFKLMRNTKNDGTGTWENAEAVSGVSGDGTVTVNSTDGVLLESLNDGLYKLQETNAPGGYIVNSGAVYFRLSGGQITFVSIQGTGADTTITEIETPTGYTVVNKTATTPVTLSVANIPGDPLPYTGGTGKTIYTLGGLALMGSALVYGFGLRRRRERRFNE